GRSDPGAQNAWFGFYMQNRYGGPQQAWAFRQQHGWYDHGGGLQPGLTMALNTTGKPQPGGGSAITPNTSSVTAPDGASLVRQLQDYAASNGGIKLKIRG